MQNEWTLRASSVIPGCDWAPALLSIFSAMPVAWGRGTAEGKRKKRGPFCDKARGGGGAGGGGGGGGGGGRMSMSREREREREGKREKEREKERERETKKERKKGKREGTSTSRLLRKEQGPVRSARFLLGFRDDCDCDCDCGCDCDCDCDSKRTMHIAARRASGSASGRTLRTMARWRCYVWPVTASDSSESRAVKKHNGRWWCGSGQRSVVSRPEL